MELLLRFYRTNYIIIKVSLTDGILFFSLFLNHDEYFEDNTLMSAIQCGSFQVLEISKQRKV